MSHFKIASIILTACLSACAFSGAPANAQLLEDTFQRAVPQSQVQVQLSFAPLVKEAAPAVVNIYTKKLQQRRSGFFSSVMGSPERVTNALGSGVIIGAGGHVVTNQHVVKGATELLVVLADRREFSATLILADERTDLAVLQIDADGKRFPFIDFANTRETQVGDLVLAIGNPYGVGQTVTSGIVSALARTDVGRSDYASFIQTDAAVNPGNSGGALINMQGELVGVNTSIYSRSGGSDGIGFAIPAEMVRHFVDVAINEGTVLRPWLGVKGQAVSAAIAESQGLERPIGLIIEEVFQDGPADEAGVQPGDILMQVDGQDVFDEMGMKYFAALHRPGDIAELSVFRAGRTRTLSAPMAPPPGAADSELFVITGNHHPFAGMRVAELSPRLAEELGLDPFATGILIAGVRRGYVARRFAKQWDIIRQINGETIHSFDDLKTAIKDEQPRWEFVLMRNGVELKGSYRTPNYGLQ